MDTSTDFSIGFWQALPEPMVRSAMVLVGSSLLIHFALMAIFVPSKRTPWFVKDAIMAVAAAGMWVLCVALAGSLNDIQLATAVAAVALLLFAVSLWAFGLQISKFATYRSQTLALWNQLDKENCSRRSNGKGFK
jgi:hypothetical protein